MKENLRTILRHHRISVTKPRLAMLEAFLESHGALTYDYFLNHPSLNLNRVTVFRVLNLFTDKNIIHRIPVTDNINRYVLQQDSAIIHSNFLCKKCKKITPLEIVVSPKMKLPEGCLQQKIEIIVEGVCKSCNK